MVERYTEIVLTVIALSLSVLALQNVIEPVRAFEGYCGSMYEPCYVTGEVSVTGSVHTY